ncbi:FAD-dependent oxidoreductase, partial [Patescibacteria group bacterium]|nr:FAD-dependent oxidoreductase [Patescibacteria group bacterium]
LIVIARRELEQIGLVNSNLVEDAIVIKNKYAYPVYHLDYKSDLEKIFNYLSNFKNLQMIGRSGLYRYNNMDHSILTGFYAARNIMGEQNNILEINDDDKYHEQK